MIHQPELLVLHPRLFKKHPDHSWNPLAVPTRQCFPPPETSGNSGSGKDGFLPWAAKVLKVMKCTEGEFKHEIKK